MYDILFQRALELLCSEIMICSLCKTIRNLDIKIKAPCISIGRLPNSYHEYGEISKHQFNLSNGNMSDSLNVKHPHLWLVLKGLLKQ